MDYSVVNTTIIAITLVIAFAIYIVYLLNQNSKLKIKQKKLTRELLSLESSVKKASALLTYGYKVTGIGIADKVWSWDFSIGNSDIQYPLEAAYERYIMSLKLSDLGLANDENTVTALLSNNNEFSSYKTNGVS